MKALNKLNVSFRRSHESLASEASQQANSVSRY